MAYKKYIEKDGKLYGPYVYHSRRVNGKVISEYRGAGKKFNYKAFLLIFFGVVLMTALIYTIIFSKESISGRAVLNLEENYQENQPLEGNLILSLKEGELIPASSEVVFENNGNFFRYDLSDLVSEEPSEGGFYIKGKSVSGEGLGYGVKGTKKIYPSINFKLYVYSETFSEEVPTEGKSAEEEPEESNETLKEGQITNEIDTEETEITENINSDEEQEIITKEYVGEIEIVDERGLILIEEKEETAETPEEPEESLIADNIVSKLFMAISNSFLRLTGYSVEDSIKVGVEIEGEVSADSPFVYYLEEGQTAEILLWSVKTESEESVKTESEELPDDVVELRIEENKIIVTTNYSWDEQGFGEDYLGDSEKALALDLSNLNLTMEQEELNVSLVYSGEEIISLTALSEEGKVVINESSEEEIFNETKAEPDTMDGVNETTDKIIFTNATNVPEISSELTDEEKEILFSEFGNASVKRTANLFNERVIVKYEIGNYWVEYSYDADAKDLDSLMEIDRIRWLKDLARAFSQEENIPKKIENFTEESVI